MPKLANLRTFNDFVKETPAFTKGAIRNYIFYENTNGLKASGAILRINRKILIEPEKFMQWILQQNQGGSNDNS
ncbi:MAG: hypothetical protein ACTSXL_03265 [Alphaproteobacteria bacterium]